MEISALEIPEVKVLTPRKFGDPRGFFSETYNKRILADRGIELDFVQENHSFSAARGTIRGLHVQAPPHAQDKLVRVAQGSVLDVAVDIRRGSPTYGKYVSAVISAEAWNQILVPIGFAHGLCTLVPDTVVIYKVTSYYAPDHELGLLWNDPELEIDWPVGEDEAKLSDKDRRQPRLREFESPFDYRVLVG